MANQYLAANLIPRWEEKTPSWQKINDLQDYLFKLREGLEYELQNLDGKNFSSVFSKEQSKTMQEFLQANLEGTLNAIQAIQKITELMTREENVLTIGNEDTTIALVGTVTVNGKEINNAASAD